MCSPPTKVLEEGIEVNRIGELEEGIGKTEFSIFSNSHNAVEFGPPRSRSRSRSSSIVSSPFRGAGFQIGCLPASRTLFCSVARIGWLSAPDAGEEAR